MFSSSSNNYNDKLTESSDSLRIPKIKIDENHSVFDCSLYEDKEVLVINNCNEDNSILKIGTQSYQFADISIPSKTKKLFPFIEFDPEKIIKNIKRRDEIFTKIKKSTLYIYPWGKFFSLNESPYIRVVTAGCMFGSALQAVFEDGTRAQFIDHDIEVHKENKIIGLELDPVSPYETILFYQLEQYCSFISTLNKSGDTELLYHVPYYDYILFGIELFLDGKISLPALEDFFVKVFEKKGEYEKKIKFISEHYNVKVKIISPFDNLFDPEKIKRAREEKTILKKIFEQLNIDPDHENNKNELINWIFNHLRNNDFFPEQALVWDDLLKAIDSLKKQFEDKRKHFESEGKKINDEDFKICGIKENDLNFDCIDKIFDLGNVVPAYTCSLNNVPSIILLPGSEKQIQILQENINKTNGLSLSYGPILKITTFEQMVAYGWNETNQHKSKHEGLLFYYPGNLNHLNQCLDMHLNDESFVFKNTPPFVRQSTAPDRLSIDEEREEKNRLKPTENKLYSRYSQYISLIFNTVSSNKIDDYLSSLKSFCKIV